MKKLLIIFFLLIINILADKYYKIRLTDENIKNVIVNYRLDNFYILEKNSIISYIDDKTLLKLKNDGILFEIIIDDVEKYYSQRNKLDKINSFNDPLLPYGSMGGFLTLDEINNFLDSLKLKFPDLVSDKFSIGKSIEGRDIYCLKISDNPYENDDTTEILMTSLIHAREPESMMNIIYFINYLVTNYNSNKLIKYLVDNTEIYFIPCINPDGYEYNYLRYPNGGGMWRKNRRDNGDGTYGVDLNRNFGYKWGYDNMGSSPYTSDETYRGIKDFSEPETQAIRDFCISHRFKLVINYHTYSNCLMYPWSYDNVKTPDSTEFEKIAFNLTKYNNYITGTAYEAIGYVSNGDTDDWMYGEQDLKNKIFAMTAEIGNRKDGFWPSKKRIPLLVKRCLKQNINLLKTAHFNPFIHSYKLMNAPDYYSAGDTIKIKLKLSNYSFNNIDSLELFFESNNGSGILGYYNIPSFKSVYTDTLNFIIHNYENYNFSLYVKHNDIIYDSLYFYFDLRKWNILFYDDFEENIKFKSIVNWGIDSSIAYSGKYSLGDSPYRNYDNYSYSYIYTPEIVIPEEGNTYLTYFTNYNIESKYDFGRIFAVDENGEKYYLKANRMVIGSGTSIQNDTTYGYQGKSEGWIKEFIDISDFKGKKINIYFEFMSDGYVTFNGWNIDNVMVINFSNKCTEINELDDFRNKKIVIYPNPARDYIQIDNIKGYFEIYNNIGQLIEKGYVDGKIDIKNLSSGLFYLKVNNKVYSFIKIK